MGDLGDMQNHRRARVVDAVELLVVAVRQHRTRNAATAERAAS